MAGKQGRGAIYFALGCAGAVALAVGAVALVVLNTGTPIGFATLRRYIVASTVAVGGAVVLSLAVRFLESAG